MKKSKDLSTKYYQKNKDNLQKIAQKRYPDLDDSITNNIKNLPEDEKRRLVEYRKKLL